MTRKEKKKYLLSVTSSDRNMWPHTRLTHILPPELCGKQPDLQSIIIIIGDAGKSTKESISSSVVLRRCVARCADCIGSIRRRRRAGVNHLVCARLVKV